MSLPNRAEVVAVVVVVVVAVQRKGCRRPLLGDGVNVNANANAMAEWLTPMTNTAKNKNAQVVLRNMIDDSFVVVDFWNEVLILLMFLLPGNTYNGNSKDMM